METRSVLGVLLAQSGIFPDAKREIAKRLIAEYFNGDKKEMRFHLTHDSWGCPKLLINRRPCPKISFSRGLKCIWAALGHGAGLGVDEASAIEFEIGYPYHRAFSPYELTWASDACGSLSLGSALLWSVKEAAVKSLGTGFHTIHPSEIICEAPLKSEAKRDFPVPTSLGITAYAMPLQSGFLSLAIRG